VEGIGISLISKDSKEILYASAKQLEMQRTETDINTMTNISLKWLQVDNQTPLTNNPIFIYPTIITEASEKEKETVLFASFCLSKDQTHGVEFFEWFTVLLQELSIDLDEEFLQTLIEFFKFEKIVEEKGYDTTRVIQFPVNPDVVEGRMYFEKLLLQPVQVNMSYTQSDKSTGVKAHSSGPLSLVYDVLTATVGNIHNAPIRLNALEVSNLLVSRFRLQDLIFNYYSDEIYRQIHRLVGSADFLGNPVGLFKNISSGVKDMFYSPILGFEITKPEEFGIGVAKGASSLMKKTVFGLSDTVTKFTGSVGKGLSVLTMDSKFQDQRRQAKRFYMIKLEIDLNMLFMG
jgi:vacuolar protein sorting-associated protein 13A/C